MKHWSPHPSILKISDLKWTKKDAWAPQAIAKNGKFYLYVPAEHDDTHPGKAIGVAVSDTPTGPFKDARGSALITNEMTPKGQHSWEDIDPTVLTDTDGTTWIAWGNRECYIAKLKPNMIELDGPIREITPPFYVEGPWLHRRGNLYYLTYASMDPAAKLGAKPGDEHVSYAALTIGAQKGALGRRAVTVERLYYNPDGTMKPVAQTEAGVSGPQLKRKR
ncbi:family 43 glycosylhydrolase [Sphingomonas sp. Leaf208]|uniref:family 43 glycosylhydrolase n=1 Tax=Sphingomonas sp. Leaf208 TaxID=1735679 RepID=UPI000A94860B|nr:family 43 glycosylhydrolase [Sphingomonas sp. Leaf208]